jgi:hypothetical protein
LKKRILLEAILALHNRSYEVLPLREDIVIFRQLDESSISDGLCPLNDPTPSEKNGRSIACTGPDCSNPSFHLVHIRPQDYLAWLQTEFGGDPILIIIFDALVAQSFRGALQNSGYPNASMTYTAVNITFNYASTTNPNIGADLATLNNIANNLMATHNGDVAVMMTSLDYPGIRGSANCIGPGGNCRFAIAEAPACVGPTWTYAHELAHCFGARHDREVCGDFNNACAHAWRYATSGEDRTILHCLFNTDIQGGHSRTLGFSNPNISINGNATGTTTANNAFWLATELCWSIDINGNTEEFFGSVNQYHVVGDKQFEVEIFPNPVLYEISVILPDNDFNEYEILNSSGKLIEKGTITQQHIFNINVGDLKSGIYYIVVKGQTDNKVNKLVKL